MIGYRENRRSAYTNRARTTVRMLAVRLALLSLVVTVAATALWGQSKGDADNTSRLTRVYSVNMVEIMHDTLEGKHIFADIKGQVISPEEFDRRTREAVDRIGMKVIQIISQYCQEMRCEVLLDESSPPQNCVIYLRTGADVSQLGVIRTEKSVGVTSDLFIAARGNDVSREIINRYDQTYPIRAEQQREFERQAQQQAEQQSQRVTASTLPTVPPAQTADYNSVVAQARTDLSAGHNEQALAGSQKAIGIDPSRWEAYLVAGSALENQKQFDPAIANYTKALERAPEPKKAGVRELLEQCKKLSAASSSAAPVATAQSPTFKETLDWVISKNVQEGMMFTIHFDTRLDEFSFHVDFSIPQDLPPCQAGLTNDTRSPWKYPDLDHPVLIDFSALAPNSIGIKRLDAHHLGIAGTFEGTLTSPYDSYFEVTGLRGWVNGDALGSPPVHEFDFQINYRAPVYSDQDLANRVAKALNHAIDVCGGKGKPEAF